MTEVLPSCPFSLYLEDVSSVESDTSLTTELAQHHQAQGDQERPEDGAVQEL